jgi:hypothetical protein
MTKKLKPFTCPSTGVTVMIFPISQVALTLQTRREIPQPKAPVVVVEIGGQQVVERNHADPDYIEAVKLWEALLQVEVTDRILKRIALKQTLNEEQTAEVVEFRQTMNGEVLPASDKLLWLVECAIGTDNDLQEMIKAATGMADPNEEGVNQAAKNFRR